MNIIQIGVAEIHYDETGHVLSASFSPTIKVELETNVLLQLASLPKIEDPAVMKGNANLVLATWFEKISEIELSDKFTYEIVPVVQECVRYANGNIKLSKIQYFYRKIGEELKPELVTYHKEPSTR